MSREGEEEGMFLQVGHFVIGIESDWVVVLVEYQDTIAYYLIDSVDNLTVLVVEKGNPDTLNFKEYLKAMLPFLEGEEVWENGRVKSVLDTHWELYLERAPVNADGFQKFISSTGHVVGKGIVTVGSKISSYWNRNNQPAGEIEETSWFKRCKQKAKRWLGRTSKAMKPVVDPLVNKGKEVNEKIGDKIDQGDSEIMKYIKGKQWLSQTWLRSRARLFGISTWELKPQPEGRIPSTLNPMPQPTTDNQVPRNPEQARSRTPWRIPASICSINKGSETICLINELFWS